MCILLYFAIWSIFQELMASISKLHFAYCILKPIKSIIHNYF